MLISMTLIALVEHDTMTFNLYISLTSFCTWIGWYENCRTIDCNIPEYALLCFLVLFGRTGLVIFCISYDHFTHLCRGQFLLCRNSHVILIAVSHHPPCLECAKSCSTLKTPDIRSLDPLYKLFKLKTEPLAGVYILLQRKPFTQTHGQLKWKYIPIPTGDLKGFYSILNSER